MNELVCLNMPNGPRLVERIQKAWDNGDAIFPLDQRLPQPAIDELLSVIQPTLMATENEEIKIPGVPVLDGDAVVVTTSGTSGQPKGVVLTHDAIRASAFATSERLAVNEKDKWLACLPPSHVGGLSVILRSLITNTPLIAVPEFTVADYTAAANNGATLVSLVSTALQRVDASLYRTILLGGAKPPATRPSNCVTTYGMTETGSGVVYDGVPLTNVEIEIRDKVIWLRCPMLLRAYRDGSNPLDAQGWFRTGDIGSFSNNVLHVEGREGDLIISGGENIWPEVVEQSLSSLPGVLQVCVAGAPDPEWGQRVVAWLVTQRTISLDEVREHVKKSLPAYCAPKEIVMVSEIPRTPLGKPKRAELVKSLSK